jgi:predicted nucleic acid-binding protein
LKDPINTTVRFVLDASVAIRWALGDGSSTDIKYADKVLDSFKTHQAIVPALWYTEMAHVMGNAAKRGLIPVEICAPSISRINSLPIAKDEANLAQSQSSVIQLMQELGTSGYDSQYLEIAVRLSLPLATLDIDLRKAAKKLNVAIYLV